jgi:glyoxylase-like metal-dependent hydrolase (beta-lactamase superfamily II)/rhodanese-related sulfurtransferase
MTGEDEFPTTDVPVEAMDPEDLLERVERGDPVRILDVRASSEYDEWHIEGAGVADANVPYFHFLDGVTDDLLDQVPPGDGPLVAVCAKGGASEYVAGLLSQEDVDAQNLADGMVGWGRIYRANEVTDYDGPGTVWQYQRPSSGCLAYLVASGSEAVVVDPLHAFVDRYRADADDADAEIVAAIDTHVHADHVSGTRSLAAATGAEIVLPAAAVDRGVEYDVDYRTVADGDAIEVGDATLDVVAAPGHTSGMTAYRVGNVLLTGDCLFTESVARPDLEEGADGAPEAAGRLYDTLHETVLAMPDDTVVAPGHYSDNATPADDGTYTARLGDLVDRMTPLSLDRDAFVEFILDDMPPRPGNFEEIIETNLGQRPIEDDEVFRLEQGPNNCAATSEAMGDD